MVLLMRISIGSQDSPAGGCRTFGGKAVGTLFFGVFFLMGAIFVVLVLGEAIKQTAPWFWAAVPCTIITSGVEETGDDESPYRPAVGYTFEVGGRTLRGDRLSITTSGTASFDRARDRAARYPPGAEATCRLDPDHPSLSVLEWRIPWIAFMVFLPLIFVAIGGGGLFFMWRRARNDRDAAVASISQNARPGRGRVVMIAMGVIFSIVGGLLFLFLFGLPALRFVQSTTWDQTPCTVVGSTIRSWSTDDGTSYRADVLYEYEADGRIWRSNRVDFFSALSSSRDGAWAVRDRFPVGVSETCWIDPGAPGKSVLDREFRPKNLLGLIPLVFLVAGLGLLHHGRRMRRPVTDDVAPTPIPEAAHGPLLLEPQWSPIGKVFGALLFALFWNGIVSLFVYQAWKSWERGHPDWFLSVFLIPFVLIGLTSFVFVGHFILALANPRPRLKVADGSPCIGDTLSIDWHFTGRSSRIDHLKIVIEGREEATYQRGTDTHTDTEVFATFTGVDTSNDWEIPRGTATIQVPADTMHTFAGNSNKVVWEIKVTGEISRWPDISQNFPITIQPLRFKDL